VLALSIPDQGFVAVTNMLAADGSKDRCSPYWVVGIKLDIENLW
jgi:hypothetical protein